VPTETELKLRFPPQFCTQIEQLTLLKTFSIAEPIHKNLYSIYYDTPDYILKKNRIALRVRKIDANWIQTIKSGGTIHDGLHQHHEWEQLIAENAPDLTQLTDEYLKGFFSDRNLLESLYPIFITDFYRTLYLLEPAKNFRLEFCIDVGQITAQKQNQPLSEQISEIELELKSGETSQLLQFSKTLQQNISFPLIPENTNKAMRGYALLK